LQLGADTKFSAKEAAEGMAELAAKGFTANQIYEAMPGILSLAATENMTVAAAARIASSTIAQFGLTVQDTTHIADALALASKSSASSVQTIGATLEYVGPIAQSVGMSFEEAAAATALLSNAGIEGERAGTGLRAVLASLVNPSSDAAESLAELGVKTTDASGSMLPFPGILTALGEAGMSSQQAFNIFGREAATAALVLVNSGGPALQSFTQRLIDSDGEAKKTADTMQKGFKGAMEQLSGSVETAGIAVGQILAPSITSLVNIVKGAADGLASFALWFAGLPDPVQKAVLAFVAIVAALGPLLLIAGQVAFAIGQLVAAKALLAGSFAAFPALATTVSAALSPILIVVAALAAAFAVWKLAEWAYDNFETFRNLVDAVWGALVRLGNWIVDGAVLYFGQMASAVETIVGWLGDFVLWIGNIDSVKGTIAFLKLAFDGLVIVVTAAAEGLTLLLDALGNSDKAVKESKIQAANAGAAYSMMGDAVKVLVPRLKPLKKTLAEIAEEKRKAKEAAAELAKAYSLLGFKDTKKEAEELEKAITKLKTSGNWNKLSVEEQEAATNKLEAAMFKAKGTTINVEAEVFKLITTNKAATIEQNAFKLAWDASATAIEAASANLSALPMGAVNTAIVAQSSALATAAGDVVILKDAFTALGIKSKTDLDAVATNAAAARDVVLGSDQATDFEKKTAVYKALQAQVDAAKQAGIDVPAAQLAMLAKMKTDLEGESGLSPIATKWGAFSTQVSTIITNFAQDISKSLWDGDLSWGEKGKKLLADLGTAVTSMFVEPAITAITGFVTNTINGLLKGSFDNVGTWLGTLGGKMSGIFGSAGAGAAAGAAGAAAGAAGVGAAAGAIPIPGVGGVPGLPAGTVLPPITTPPPTGGAAGAAGAAAGAGISGTVGMITGAVSAVSGVIGNFQFMAMNATLDLIEKEVRYSQIHLYWILDKLNEYIPGLVGIEDRLKEIITNHAWRIHDVWAVLGEIRDKLPGSGTTDDAVVEPVAPVVVQPGNIYLPVLEAIHRELAGLVQGHVWRIHDIWRELIEIKNELRHSGGANITIQGNVIGNQEFVREMAALVAAELRLQGAG